MKFGLILAVVLAAAGLTGALVSGGAFDRPPASLFGSRSGSGKPDYDGNLRISDFLDLPDGTRLAYDLYLPARKGGAAKGPFPVLFKYTPYLRAFRLFDESGRNLAADLFKMGFPERAAMRIRKALYSRGHLADAVARTDWLGEMLRRGYAAIVVERVGTGASFGRPSPSFEDASREASAVLDWIAAQPWCDGNIGMFGDSWQAQIQFAAAASGNPHLKCILPVSASLDNYTAVIRPGGILCTSFTSFFTWSQEVLDGGIVVPVDSDKDGSLLAAARAERGGSAVAGGSVNLFREYPFRDSRTADGVRPWTDWMALYPFLDRINAAGVPAFLVGGFLDFFSRDMFLWFENLTVPRKLLMRRVDHHGLEGKARDMDFSMEAVRWYDRWLKGTENGVLQEAPVRVYVSGAGGRGEWRSVPRWPVPGARFCRFHLGGPEGPRELRGSLTGTGGLSSDAPAWNGWDTFRPPDTGTGTYGATTGNRSRWTAVNWEADYGRRRAEPDCVLQYETEPLAAGVEIIGHPVVNLRLDADSRDADVFVYLDRVDTSGRKAEYLSEGMLRASFRGTYPPPFRYLGLPYRRYFEADRVPLEPGKPEDLRFDLLPLAASLEPGERLRLTIAFSDDDNFETPFGDPPPSVRILRGPGSVSWIDLPVVRGHLP